VELEAADALGLVPDPWRQTGEICATIANASGKLEKPMKAADFIPMDRRHERQDMGRLYWERKRQHGGSRNSQTRR
jgi:hypothetical protein